MRWIVGNGNEGKMQEIESRIQKNEAQMQKLAGVGAGFAGLVTVLNLALNGLRLIHK